MREVFYGIVSFLLVAFLIFAWTHDSVYELPEDLEGIVINKASSKWIGDYVTILQLDSTTEMFICYDILFDELTVGDTIK